MPDVSSRRLQIRTPFQGDSHRSAKPGHYANVLGRTSLPREGTLPNTAPNEYRVASEDLESHRLPGAAEIDA